MFPRRSSPSRARILLLVPLCGFSPGLTAPASAQTVELYTILDGDQAGSSIGMDGNGSFTVNTVTNSLTFDITHSGVPWPFTEDSFLRGPAEPGQSGQVLTSLPDGDHKSGTINYPEHWEPWLLGGMVYVWVQTTMPGQPAIRGQIVVTPTHFCFCGPGSGAPCGNEDDDRGCVNSTGSGAWLGKSGGLPSVQIDTLELRVEGMPPGQFGLIFMGAGEVNLPFVDGVRCVGGELFRFPIRIADGNGRYEEGPGIVQHSLASFPLSGHIQAGQVWGFQAWYRDPLGPCGSGSNLTKALRVTFTP